MVIESGVFRSECARGSVDIRIEVYPRSFDIIDLQKRAERELCGCGYVFVYNLDNAYTSEGGLLPKTISTLGFDVPARARELWRVPRIDGGELVCHLLKRRPLIHPCRRGEFTDADLMIGVFNKTRFLDYFSPRVINGSWYQFTRIGSGREEMEGLLNELIEFNSRMFGAYRDGKSVKKYLKNALKLGLFEVGYVDVEQSC